jgi:hypothetical protein
MLCLNKLLDYDAILLPQVALARKTLLEYDKLRSSIDY